MFPRGVSSAASDVLKRQMLATAGGGSMRPPIQITISGNTFGSRDDIDYLMDEMDRRLRLQGAFRL